MKLLLIAVLAIGSLPAEEKLIHPLVFEQVMGWISDTESPVVLQVSLDAMRKDCDQYDYDEVSVHDGIVRWTDGKESCWYRTTDRGNGVMRYEVWSNGGGSLTEHHLIDATVAERKLIIGGTPRSIAVLEVVAFDPEMPAGR